MDTHELLISSRSISLRFSSHPSSEDMQDAFILFCGLTKLGKEVRVENFAASDLFPSRSSSQEKERTFSLTIKDVAPFISRVYYEKDRANLKLYFALSDNTIQQEKIKLEPLSSNDLTIIVGNTRSPLNGQAPPAHPGILPATIPSTNVTQLLLQQFFPTQQALLRLGGILFASVSRSPDNSLYIGHLASKEFANTQTTPKSLPSVMNLYKECFGEQHSYLFLYETPESHENQGLLWSSAPSVRNKLFTLAQGQEKGHWALLHYSTQTLLENKEKTIHEFSTQ